MIINHIGAREDEVIVNFKLLYGYAALLPEGENKYKNLQKVSKEGRQAIGGQDMNDYPSLKMLIFKLSKLKVSKEF